MPTPYKEWRITEAERCGVHERTIDRWRARGYYKHLKFKAVTQRVLMVSGREKKPRAKESKFHKRYDWSKVDWSKSSSAIAREIGCHRTAVVLHKRFMKRIDKANRDNLKPCSKNSDSTSK